MQAKLEKPFSVAPILCGRCNAPVPIVNEQSIQTCVQCGAPCELPLAHQELFLSRQQSTAQLAQAAESYKHIGEPPHPLVSFLATVVEWVVLPVAAVFLWVSRLFIQLAASLARVHVVMLAVALVPFALLYRAISTALHTSVQWLGVDAISVLGPCGAWSIAGAVLLTAIALPIGISRRFEELGVVRARLRATLAATEPTTSGGSSCCRCCGAALAVAPGAFGARCLYCQPGANQRT